MWKITVLVDDREGRMRSLRAAHGLSLAVEGEEDSFLFDVGPDDTLVHNAALMDIDLGAFRTIVLSHAHYDHCGGLRALAGAAPRRGIRLLTGEGFLSPRWTRSGRVFSYIGCGFGERFLAEAWMERQAVGRMARVAPGAWLLSKFRTLFPFEGPDVEFEAGEAGAARRDPFLDECTLALEMDDGRLALVVGCAHPGVVSIATQAAERTGRRIGAVFGGAHLSKRPDADIARALEALAGLGVERLGLFHCSGPRASEIARETRRFSVDAIRTGDVFLV